MSLAFGKNWLKIKHVIEKYPAFCKRTMGMPLEYLFTYICMVNIKNSYYTFILLPIHSIGRMNIFIKMKNMLVDAKKQQKGIVQTYNLDDEEEIGMVDL